MRYDITPKGVVVATVEMDGRWKTVVHPHPGADPVHARDSVDSDEAINTHEKIWQACLSEDYAKI